MTVAQGNEYDTMPWWVKWTLNWYVVVSMFMLCTFNLVDELSTQAPDTISIGLALVHVMCILWWLNQGKRRNRMNREARRLVL